MSTATKNPRPRAKKTSSRHLDPLELRPLRQRFGLSQTLLARLLDVSLRTISGLEAGSVTPAKFRRNITQLNRICEALREATEPAHVGQWLDEPNEMLGGLKPVEAIERGQIDLVWQVIEGLRSGSPL
jgi:DNA-binding XRE family transcriptional regulator